MARVIEKQQPIKFAAMELVPHTKRGVTEWIGGISLHGHVYFGIGIPYLDSIFVGSSPNYKIIGWSSVPASQRAPVPSMIHLCFDAMVGLGTLLLVLAAWQGWVWWFHRRVVRSRWFLAAAALSGTASVVAMECGWIVTEVGRQPWVVYGVLLTKDAVTPSHGVPVTLGVIVAIYLVLSAVTVGVPWLMSRRWRAQEPEREDRENVPYGPPPAGVGGSAP